jgi:tRNA 2-selenouridine synthase
MAPLVVLAGLAGVGKTALLAALADAGEHVVDLEALAGHRGSAFGGLGRPPQPGQSTFDDAVAAALGFVPADAASRVFVEDEGAFVGSLTVPAMLRVAIDTTPVVEVAASLESRVARLVADYGDLEPALLIRATQRIRRRIGDPVADRAVRHFAAGRPGAAIRALLPHFDAAYRHRWDRLARPVLARIDADA